MAWIRDTHEAPERRPTDVARLVVCALGVAVSGLWAQTASNIDTSLFKIVNDLPNALDGTAHALDALGTIWAVAAVVALLAALRLWRVAMCAGVAGAGAWAAAELLQELLGPHSLAGVTLHVRSGDPPAFPSTATAVATALALGLAPYAVRPLRRLSLLVVLGVGLSSMYLGNAFTADVLGGLFLGAGVAASVFAILGAPGGRPSLADVRLALGELGLDVEQLDYADEQIPRATVLHATLASGQRLRIDAFGRDQRDGQLAAKVWRRAMYREPGLQVFGSRLQQVEHLAYALVLAERARVCAPELVTTGVAGPDAALLVTSLPTGTRLDRLPADDVTDGMVDAAWEQVRRLHAASISHGNLTPHAVVIEEAGAVGLDRFDAASASATQFWLNRDDAALLVGTAALLGNERAIERAIAALGREHVGEVIPHVQPAGLPTRSTPREKHWGRALKQLRSDLSAATGVEDVQPLKIRRLTWTNIGMLVGVLLALSLAISGLEGIDFASVKNEFEDAIWGWAALTAILYPLVIVSWATALMGCVNTDLPFAPTVLTQLACSFLNLITPNGIGGTALQLDYLHKQGVPVASGGSAMVLSTGVGGALQMALLISAAALTSTSLDLSSSSGSTSLWIIALVAAGIGVVLLVPKIRGKVVPAVRRAAGDIWTVLRTPKKALQLFGGDLAGNLLYPALLGLCLLAFHQSLGFAELIVVQMGAGILGNVAPVPGGIGVQEAALTAGLTSFGIPAAPALATVLVFRGITFLLPPIFGFFTLRWLRAKGYA